MSNMTPFLLWNEICEFSEIPCDVRRYLIFCFILPFEKAERESTRVNEIYDKMIEECEGRFFSNPVTVQECKPKIEALLKDDSLEFNPYIGATQRITRLIIIINQTWLFHNDTARLALLKKGLLIDDMLAFRILYTAELPDSCQGVTEFVMRASERLLALPSWGSITSQTDLYDIQLITRYCLDKELDNIVMDFMSEGEQKDVNPFDSGDDDYFGDLFTDEQYIRFCHIRDDHICFRLMDRMFEEALGEK